MRNARGRRSPDRPLGDDPDRSIHWEDVRRSRELIAGVDHESVADFFAALADPTRLRIVHVLMRQEMCTSDLAVTLSLSEPVVSQHLRVLRNLDLVTSRRAGRIVYYSVSSRPLGRAVELGIRARGEHEVSGRSATPMRAGRAGSRAG
jgi:DNA-binding transcriptional ArsR family regulator